MPSYIVKAAPDEDWYCLWSTIVDAPLHWGSRSDMERMSYDPREVAAERFERADRNGSSARWPNWPDERQPFAWTDDSFILMEAGPGFDDDHDSGCWLLPRGNLRAFCEALEAESDTTSLCVWESHEEPSENSLPPGPAAGGESR